MLILPIYLDICGYETVEAMIANINIDTFSTLGLNFDLQILFNSSGSELCGIQEYTLKDATGIDPIAAELTD